MTIRWMLLLVATWAALPAQAERATRSDGYVIHYNAITTDQLTPEVAQRLAIVRSSNRALVNIAVLREADGEGLDQPLRASVRGSATNAAGQFRQINMREVRDGGAIYYLGEVRVEHLEALSFEFSVRPEGAERDYPVRFRQTFHTR